MVNLTNINLLKLLKIFGVLAKLNKAPCSSCNVPNVVPSMPSFLRVPYLRVMISGSRYRLEYCHIDSLLFRKRSHLMHDEVVAYGRWASTEKFKKINKFKLN